MTERFGSGRAVVEDTILNCSLVADRGEGDSIFLKG